MDWEYWRRILVGAAVQVGPLVLLTIVFPAVEGALLYIASILTALAGGYIAAKNNARNLPTGIGAAAWTIPVAGTFGFLSGYIFQIAFNDPAHGLIAFGIIAAVLFDTPFTLLAGAITGRLAR